MTETLQIIIMPDIDSIQKSMGYDEFDDSNSDAILSQQGSDGEVMEIADEEEFEINNNFIAKIYSDNEYFLLENKKQIDFKLDFIVDELPSGRYKYCSEGNIIYILSSKKHRPYSSG